MNKGNIKCYKTDNSINGVIEVVPKSKYRELENELEQIRLLLLDLKTLSKNGIIEINKEVNIYLLAIWRIITGGEDNE